MPPLAQLSDKELKTRLASLRSSPGSIDDTVRSRRLQLELQVHQIELEMQNRELREAQLELEMARDRYADLYDFAPVGYLTFDPKGILTRDGKLNQDSRRKLKQVYHLYNFIEPLLQDVLAQHDDFTLADHGAGKSYLGFTLYDLFLKTKPAGHVYGIETRQDLVEKSRELAARLGFQRMSFLNLSVRDAIESKDLPPQIDIVTALHACNTTTDDAIKFALDKKARHIVLVPCCQAEVASVLRKYKNESFGKTPLSEIWRHPIHR